MPQWTIVSALVSKVTQVFEPNQLFTPATVIEEKDARTLLKNIHAVLQRTNCMVTNHKALYQQTEYATFLAQNVVLHSKFVDEERYQSKLNDNLAQQGLSSSEVRRIKEAARARVVDLNNLVNAYEDRVVHASQRARTLKIEAFPDEIAQEPSEAEVTPDVEPIPSRTSPTIPTQAIPAQPLVGSSRHQPKRPCFVRFSTSLMKGINTQTGIFNCIPAVGSDVDKAMIQQKELKFAILHTALCDEEPEHLPPTSSTLYKRTVVLRYGENELEIPDDELYEMKESEVTLSPEMVFELQDVIQDWMRDLLAKDID